ncbi:MAG: hypothetical protein ACOVQN_04130 [Exiguobacterium sp.]|jgi:hypothetical protein
MAVVDLTEFIEKDLYPKFTVASNVWNALLDQQKANRGKDVPLEEVVALNGKIRTAGERYRLLEQQSLVVWEACGRPLGGKTKVEPTTDRGFQLWMAENRICADVPDREDLYQHYLRFGK